MTAVISITKDTGCTYVKFSALAQMDMAAEGAHTENVYITANLSRESIRKNV
jgi:hypothetical protein